METGNKLYNGAIVTPQFAALYNRLTARIESYDVPPENLINGRHNALVSFAVTNVPTRFTVYSRNLYESYTDYFFDDNGPDSICRDFILTYDSDLGQWSGTLGIAETKEGDFSGYGELPESVVIQLKQAAQEYDKANPMP